MKKNNTQSKNAIIYFRVSAKDQLNGFSLQTQEKVCRKYAEGLGLTILKVFEERGESAKTAERTQLQEALRFCSKHKGSVGHFIVYRLDRFARNKEDHFTTKILLKAYGTQLVSATEGIQESPEGKLLEGVLSSLAEFDNDVRTLRTVSGMHSALQQGYWCFPCPYGYKQSGEKVNGKRQVVIDENKAEVVRYVFDEYAKGIYTYRMIYEKMKNNFPYADIQCQTIVKMLSNKFYYGLVEVKDWDISVQGKHAPIISESLFNKVSKIMNKDVTRKQPRNRNHPDFPLRGVECGACGKNMTGGWTRGKLGRRYAYYSCSNSNCPRRKSIKKDSFEQDFTDFFQSITPDKKRLDLFMAALKLAFTSMTTTENKKNQLIEKNITTLEQQKESLLELKLRNNDLISDEEFKMKKKEYEEKIEKLRMSQVDSGLDQLVMDNAITSSLEYIKNLPNMWEALDVIEFKALRGVLFPKNLVYSNGKFQTPELCVIFQINSMSDVTENALVGPRGIEPRFPG